MSASTVTLTDPIFRDEDKARAHFEACRWPNGPVCPHCGTVNQATLIQGKSHRAGMYQCNACREPFTVKVGTVMEASHIPHTKWALGFHLMASSKKGVSAHQLHRMLGVTYKSAWFMAHRIREAMDMDAETSGPLGGEGKIVEIDEVYIGGIEGNKHKNKRKHKGTGAVTKQAVFSLVERGGEVRSFHVASVTAGNLREIIEGQVSRDTHIMSDNNPVAGNITRPFKYYQSVNHAKGEYARGRAHTNTVEGYFSILKRGVIGTYHHVSEQHLHRYLKEFDFRYSNRVAVGVDDVLRTMRAIKGAEGKRLTYKQSRSAQQAQA